MRHLTTSSLLCHKVFEAYDDGFFWVLVRTSEKDVVLERREMNVSSIGLDDRPFKVLPFWKGYFRNGDEGSESE